MGFQPIAAESPRAWAEVVAEDTVLRQAIPGHFLSFNLNSVSLDADHWSEQAGGIRPDLIEAMRAFPGAFLRYPGGNVSNHFASDWAVGDISGRRPQRLTDHGAPAPVRLGPREYFDFASASGGRTWYTLNLVGWDSDHYGIELPSADVAAANARLAALRVRFDRSGGAVRYYHLGNELDRNRYRWTPTRYLQRCRDTMTAVREADPAARFVVFLRDFDASDKVADPAAGIEHARQVLAGLPEVVDASLQIYYDRPAGEGQRTDQTWRWRLIDRFLSRLPRRPGGPITMWITEHAQARDLRARELPRRLKLATTSGIGGALASADFILDALRRPQIEAAFWHALGGGVWWDLFEPGGATLKPTPVYHVMRLARAHLGGQVLACGVHSSDLGGYAGGYDLNAALLKNSEGRLSLMVVNRAPFPADLTLSLPSLDRRTRQVRRWTVAAAVARGNDSEDQLETRFSEAPLATMPADVTAPLIAAVPARSFNVIRVEPSGPGG